MELYLKIAGILASGVVVGHFAFGTQWFLRPMMRAGFDIVARRSMLAVFHYVSVFLILSALTLLWAGFGNPPFDMESVLWFILITYLAMGIWQIIIAITSGIPGIMGRMFQWTMFLLIALLIYLGIR